MILACEIDYSWLHQPWILIPKKRPCSCMHVVHCPISHVVMRVSADLLCWIFLCSCWLSDRTFWVGHFFGSG